VLPILVVGNLIGLGADGLPGHRRLLGPVVVWAVVLAGVMLVLGESPYLGRELVVLAAGALWFVGVGPLVASHRTRGQAAGPAQARSRGARTRRPGYLATLLADSRRRSELSSRHSSAVGLYAGTARPRTLEGARWKEATKHGSHA
jgi:hypothetical protein